MNLANRLATDLASRLDYDEEKRQVMAYGFGAAIQMIQLLCISLIFGLVFRCLPECLTVFVAVGLLRRSTGGTHCKTYMACILTSSLSVCLMALSCRYTIPGLPGKELYGLCFELFVFACATWMGIKRVPMDSPNKPIVSASKRRRLRRDCFITLAVYFLIAVTLLVFGWAGERSLSLSCAITCAVLWQCFTLTAWSGRLACSMDKLFAGSMENNDRNEWERRRQ